MNQFWALFSAAHPLVHIDAGLNTVATILLVVGYRLIKRGRVEAHRRTMTAAFLTSAAFLACYLTYHFIVGKQTSFPGSGGLKTFYLLLLASHILLAMSVPFLAITTIVFGMRSQGEWLPRRFRYSDSPGRNDYIAQCRLRHIRLAKVTFPVWIYVSITGVLVYVLLYYVGPSTLAV